METKAQNKVVEMETGTKQDNSTEQKLTYEELLNRAKAMQEYITKLHMQLERMNEGYFFKRLDCLFAVLRYETVFKDADFINKCIEEIKEMLTLPEKEEESKKEG